jgi:hypothetical protein
MSFQPIRVRLASPRVIAVHVVYSGETAFAPWHRPDMPLPAGPLVAFRDKRHKDYKPGSAVALQFDGALMLRRSIAADVLGPTLDAGHALLRPVRLAKDVAGNKPKPVKETLEDDWVMVETPRRHPLDRDLLPDTCFQYPAGDAAPGPHAALVVHRPDVLAFGPGREPRVPMFRLGDLPIDLFVDADLLGALQRALGDALEVGRMRPNLKILETTSTCPPFSANKTSARSAADSFWASYAAGSAKPGRNAALASPIYAYWLARAVDSAPTDDTRAGASAHPYYALLYARDVDHEGRADTREAASASPDSAYEYMRDVDHEASTVTRSGMKDSRRLPDYEVDAVRVSAVWAAAKAAATRPAAAARGVEWEVLSWGKSGRAEVNLEFVGVPQAFYDLDLPVQVLPQVVIQARELSGGSLRKRAPKLFGLDRSPFGWFVLRRSAVAHVLAQVPVDQLTLRPVRLADAAGVIDDDFVLLDVRTEVPLDRAAATAVWSDTSHVQAAFPRAVQRFAWSPSRAPRARIFRVGEVPACIVADRELVVALTEATKGAIVALKDHNTSALAVFPPDWAVDDMPPISGTEAAETAFWALYEGKGGKRERQASLESPLHAYWLARLVDGGPRDDTRSSAVDHPLYAALYARDVDGAPRPDTRRSAERDYVSADLYAKQVTVALWPGAEKTLLAGGSSKGDLATLARGLGAMRAFLGRR